jgi:C-terminal processing protease CtpA/Prc
MKSFLWLTVAGLVFCCSVVLAQNKFNGNFEVLDSKGIPVGWDLTYKNQNKYLVELDSTVSKDGKFAVSITANADEKSGAILYPINKRFEGKTLTLVGTLKTENVSSGFAGIWIRTNGVNGKVLAYKNMEVQRLTGTTDWKEYMIEVPYDGREVLNINIGAMLAGKGKVWVDNVRLFLDDKPIDEAEEMQLPTYQALVDTEFDGSSGIDTIQLTKKSIKHLALLGELWGFLKYHHPAIANGDYNWDAELFRKLPEVLECSSDSEFSRHMEKWLLKLGDIVPCTKAKPDYREEMIAVRPDYGSLFKNSVFSKTLIKKLNYILENSSNSSNYYVGSLIDAAHSSFTHELNYASNKYPDAGQRLLALYRYWSIIQYFDPNRQLISERWSKVLPEFIPQIVQDTDVNAYVNTMVKLISRIHDSHAFIRSDVYEKHLGKYKLPVRSQFIDDQLVVISTPDDSLNTSTGLRAGDIITANNKEKLSSMVDEYMLFTPASNRPAALRDLIDTHLLRSRDSIFNLDILRDNVHINILQKGISSTRNYTYSATDPQKPSYKLIDSNIGYIYCGSYKNTDLKSIRKKFENTKGIIVDMRGYPIDEMENTLVAYFKPRPVDFVKFTNRSISQPGLFAYMPTVKNGTITKDYYRGKVVVLVNETTQSNAEYVTMAIQSGSNVTTIGSSSAGADGNITPIDLPSNITTWMSGIGVYYPDGTNTQSAGVKIDELVRPTVEGIKAGKDELLEAAIKLIAN